MEQDISITAIKALFIAAVMNTFNLYSGAIVIAFFASILKLFYYKNEDEDKSCIPCAMGRNFLKFFGISLPLTLFMVHVCMLYEFDPQLSIVYSAIVAFLGREILDIVVVEIPPILKKIILRNYNKD